MVFAVGGDVGSRCVEGAYSVCAPREVRREPGAAAARIQQILQGLLKRQFAVESLQDETGGRIRLVFGIANFPERFTALMGCAHAGILTVFPSGEKRDRERNAELLD